MALFTANFEAGVAGATITTGGGEASASAWTTVDGSPTYSNTHAAHGGLSGKIVAGTPVNLFWTLTLGSITENYGRLYLYATAYPGGAIRFVDYKNNSSIVVDSGGHVGMYDGSFNYMSTPIALNQWVRIEWHLNWTTKAVEIKLFNSAESTSDTETLSLTASGMEASVDRVQIGNQGGGNWGSDYWIDDIVANATSYPGPVVLKTADFEGGTDGATITTGVGESSATPWSGVGVAPVYSATHVANGLLAANFTAASDALQWSLSNPTDLYGRIYLYFTANASNYTRLIYVKKAGTVVFACLLNVGTTRLIIQDKAAAHELTSTNGFSLNQWVRLEWRVHNSGTVGQVEIKMFDDADSSTPLETLTSPASWDTDTQSETVEFGNLGGGAENYWADNIQVGTEGWLGPATPTDGLSGGFELGTLAANVETTDPGNETPWDNVIRALGNTVTYDATHAILTQSAKAVSLGGGGGAHVVWDAQARLGIAPTNYYWRVYAYFEDLPGAVGACDLVRAARNAFADNCWVLLVRDSGDIDIENAASTQDTFTNPMPTDQWVRFEGHTNHEAQSLQIKLFLDADSDTPDETITYTGGGLRADTEDIRFGQGNLNTTVWIDQIVAGASQYMGPEAGPPEPEVAQVLSMLAHVSGHSVW